MQFISGPSKGLNGIVSGVDPANTNAGLSVLVHMSGLSRTPTVGDYYIIQSQPIPGGPTAGWWPGVSGGATLTANYTDLSPNTPGKQALQMNATGSGQYANVTSYFDSLAGHSFVQLNGSYTLTFRAKALGGSNTLQVSLYRLGTARGNITYFNQNVQLTNQWHDYTFTFNGNDDGTVKGNTALSFSISGGSALLDDAALMEDAASDNPTPFRNAVVDRPAPVKARRAALHG